MRIYRNGARVELATDFPVTRLADRVLVHTPEGTFSGVSVAQGNSVLVSFRGHVIKFDRSAPSVASDHEGGTGRIVAPMPGLLVEILAAVGQELKRGSKLAVLEAMKTQMPMTMPFDGIVDEICATPGAQVEQDTLIAVVKPVETA